MVSCPSKVFDKVSFFVAGLLAARGSLPARLLLVGGGGAMQETEDKGGARRLLGGKGR